MWILVGLTLLVAAGSRPRTLAAAAPLASSPTSPNGVPASPEGDGGLRFLDGANPGAETIGRVGPLREGYTTLWWSTDPQATGYRLTDVTDNRVVYRGHLPQAFLSGLADGEYRYAVAAIDATGRVVTAGADPMVVEVQHWDRRMAWFLFAIGAVVVTILLGVLLAGARVTRTVRPTADSALDSSVEAGRP